MFGSNKNLRVLLLATTAITASTGMAFADTTNFLASGPTSDWNTDANWTGDGGSVSDGTAPTSTIVANFLFPSANASLSSAGAALALTSDGPVSINLSGQSLTLAGETTANSYTYNGSIGNSGSKSTITIGTAGGGTTSTQVLAGSIQNAISLNAAAGYLQLTGTGSNYSGGTTIGTSTDVANVTAANVGVLGTGGVTLNGKGTLSIAAGANQSVSSIANAGTVNLAGAMVTTGSMTNSGSLAVGAVGSPATITGTINNTGKLNVTSGTLIAGNGITGQGQITIGAGSGNALDLSGGSTNSQAKVLSLGVNATMALGGNTATIGSGGDYNNGNFGSGNSFNKLGNVTTSAGSNGVVNGGLGTLQTVTAISNGNTATIGSSTSTTSGALNFGNVHVGDATQTGTITVKNTGTNAAVLRGALQTAANGANVTDGRLSGLTAGNFGTLAANGTKTYTASFNPTTSGALTGQAVNIASNFSNIGNQKVNLTGAAYNYGTAASVGSVSVANQHVGGTTTAGVSITNTGGTGDGYVEGLNASISGTSGQVANASGSVTNLGAGQTSNTTNSSAIQAGVDTTSAGHKTGTLSLSQTSNGTISGLPNTSAGSQTVNVTGDVCRLAQASASPSTVDAGAFHVGSTGTVSANITVSNTATKDGYSEGLGVTGVTGSGAFGGSATAGYVPNTTTGLINPGNSNTTAAVASFNKALGTVGVNSGSVAVAVQSDGTGTSGLGVSVLSPLYVNVTAEGYNYASAAFAKSSGAGIFTGGGSVYRLTRTLTVGSSPTTTMLALLNLLENGATSQYTDLLGGSFTSTNTTQFNLTGFGSFNGVSGGSSLTGLTVNWDPTDIGTYEDLVTFYGISQNSILGNTDMVPITLDIVMQVQDVNAPEPGTLAVLLSGPSGVYFARRRRRG